MSRRTLLEAPSRGLALLLDLALEPRRQVVEVALGEDGFASVRTSSHVAEVKHKPLRFRSQSLSLLRLR